MTIRPISNVAAYWTDSGTSYTGLGVNVYATAAATSSKVLKLSYNNSQVFSVDRNGSIVSNTVNSMYNTANAAFNYANTISQISLGGNVRLVADGQVIGSTTVMTFQQSSAPVGFTKITTYNDYAMRIVSGSVANKTDGVNFTTAFVSKSVSGTVGATTLTTDQIPAHSHTVYDPGHSHMQTGSVIQNYYAGVDNSSAMQARQRETFTTQPSTTGISLYNTGGGGSHTHTFTGTAINLAVNYLDFILASAN